METISPAFTKPRRCAQPVKSVEKNYMGSLPFERYFQGSVISSPNHLELFKTAVMNCVPAQELKQPICTKFLTWQPAHNQLAIWTMYAYADEILPLELDCVFSLPNPINHEFVPLRVEQSIWNGYLPSSDIGMGHKHLLIVELNSEVSFPALLRKTENFFDKTFELDELPKSNVGLCRRADFPAIQTHLLSRLKE
ncbi:MAG: hypothetical protein EOO88_23385 [Pedobacter sp.]|nr:MAG: hypothetical protein EOO88_23385 [Pedobacter sp.]